MTQQLSEYPETVFSPIVAAVRWTARLLGLFLGVFVIAMFLDNGVDLSTFTPVLTAMLVAFGIATIGMFVLWRWELPGGALVVAGMIAFYALEWSVTGSIPGGWVFPLFFVPGVLALVAAHRSRGSHSS